MNDLVIQTKDNALAISTEIKELIQSGVSLTIREKVMNHKQKLGYTLLGAGIMALGIIVGEFVTPNIEAQSNGVFEKITCRELYVVDAKGETEIGLGGNSVVIHDKQGRLAVVLSSMEVGNGITVFDNQGKIAGSLVSSKEENFVSVSDKQGQKAVGLSSRKEFNAVIVSDNQGREAVVLVNTEGTTL